MGLIGVSILDLHLAVVAGGPAADGSAFELASPVFFGTAFPILPGVFVTAAHVVRAARDSGGKVAFCRTGPRRSEIPSAVHLVDDVELFDGLDLALVKCAGHSNLVPLPLLFEPLDVLTPVTAVGFAVGVDVQYQTFVHRAFAGHIVTRRGLYHLQPDQPPGYELSFVTPPGLSGAPLVIRTADGAFVAGHIVHWWRVELEGAEYRFGIAVASEALIGVTSAIVGGSLVRALSGEPRPLRPPSAPSR